MISFIFSIWHHWYTWDAWCWLYLGNSDAAVLVVTGADCGGRCGCWNSFPVTIHYFSGCISSPKRPCCTPPNSDWIYCFDEFHIFAENIFRFGSHSYYLVSSSLVWLNFSLFLWPGHIGAGIKSTILVELFFCVGDWLKISGLFFVFVFVCVDPVPFIFLLCLIWSDLPELDSCW